MKRVIFALALTLTTLGLYASKASAVIYKMAPSPTQYQVEDENVAISYNIYQKNIDDNPKFGPNPYLKVIFTNKTDGVVRIDLGASKVLVGDDATPMSMEEKVVSVEPGWAITIEDIALLNPGCEKVLGDRIYFKEVGKGNNKQKWCYSYKFDNLNSGDILEFDPENSPFNIGAEIVYTTDKDSNSPKAMSAEYYVERIVGTTSSAPLPLGLHVVKDAVDSMTSDKNSLVGTRADDRERGVQTIQLWCK